MLLCPPWMFAGWFSSLAGDVHCDGKNTGATERARKNVYGGISQVGVLKWGVSD